MRHIRAGPFKDRLCTVCAPIHRMPAPESVYIPEFFPFFKLRIFSFGVFKAFTRVPLPPHREDMSVWGYPALPADIRLFRVCRKYRASARASIFLRVMLRSD